MRYVYPAIIKRDGKHCYLVRFPDLENCFTDGESIKESLQNARDVLNLTLCNMEERGGISIPKSSNIDDIKLDLDESAIQVSADTDSYREIYKDGDK